MTPAVAICIPHLGWNHFLFTQALGAQMHQLGIDGYNRLGVFSGSASTGAFRSRNGIMKDLASIEKKHGWRFDWTMWFDSDMNFPSRTAQALIAHDKDIVGATYKRRAPPFELMAQPASGHTEDIEVGKLTRAIKMPAGCLLIRRSVFDSIKSPIWKIDMRDGFDAKGEDVIFCEEAMAQGYEVWLDTQLTVMVQHIAEIPLSADVETIPTSIIMPEAVRRPLILNA